MHVMWSFKNFTRHFFPIKCQLMLRLLNQYTVIFEVIWKAKCENYITVIVQGAKCVGIPIKHPFDNSLVLVIDRKVHGQLCVSPAM